MHLVSFGPFLSLPASPFPTVPTPWTFLLNLARWSSKFVDILPVDTVTDWCPFFMKKNEEWGKKLKKSLCHTVLRNYFGPWQGVTGHCIWGTGSPGFITWLFKIQKKKCETSFLESAVTMTATSPASPSTTINTTRPSTWDDKNGPKQCQMCRLGLRWVLFYIFFLLTNILCVLRF